MLAVQAKIYGVLYKQYSSIAFDETSSYWSALKSSKFLGFHWSPHSSLVSIGQTFVTKRVVHLPKRTERSLITESDQSGPNHQLLQLCTARTAWSDSDQAVRAVHSCISWFKTFLWKGHDQNVCDKTHQNDGSIIPFHCVNRPKASSIHSHLVILNQDTE